MVSVASYCFVVHYPRMLTVYGGPANGSEGAGAIHEWFSRLLPGSVAERGGYEKHRHALSLGSWVTMSLGGCVRYRRTGGQVVTL